MMRPLAPVRVRGDRLYAAEQVDWIATCRVCGERLTTGEHEEALAWAHGHMHVRHPGWHDGNVVNCEDCGTRLTATNGSMDDNRCWECVSCGGSGLYPNEVPGVGTEWVSCPDCDRAEVAHWRERAERAEAALLGDGR